MIILGEKISFSPKIDRALFSSKAKYTSISLLLQTRTSIETHPKKKKIRLNNFFSPNFYMIRIHLFSLDHEEAIL